MQVDEPTTKPKRKRLRLKEGDVFRFDAGQGEYGLGQLVIVEKSRIFIVMYHGLYDAAVKTENVEGARAFLRGWTQDGSIYRGRWEILGNSTWRPQDLNFPIFRANVFERGVWIKDHLRNLIRPATPDEVERYDLEWSTSSDGFDYAFRALHGREKWIPIYAKMLNDRSDLPSSLIQ